MAPAANLDLLGDSDDDGVVADIKINEAYQKRFNHNKQREDLHRLQEHKKQGRVVSSDSDSESSDEDEDGLIPESTEIQIYETLAKIKKKDPLIYQKDAKLYNDEDEEAVENAEKPKKKKALYLKDVMAQHLLENGPDFEENRVRNVPKSYAEEQDELKRAFLEAGDSDDEDDGGLLTVKKKTAEELRREKKEEEEAVAEAEQRARDAGIKRKLNEYFGEDNGLDPKDSFLKNYLMNKGWIERESKGFDYKDVVTLSDDENHLEMQEKFEAKHNFRFEEGAGDQVLGHPRFAEGSVRKKPNARKLQRENKQTRQAKAEFERKEELKRLKNVKKHDILKKLEKIKAVAGVVGDQGNVVDEEDLDDDFDPAEYDRKMRKAFGDEYYGAEDPDEEFQGHDVDYLEKPDFDAEDELLDLPKGWDGRETDGFDAAREKAKEGRRSDPESVEDGAEEDEANEDEDEEDTIITDSGPEGAVDGDGVEGVGDEPEQSGSRKKRKGRVSLREKLAFDKQLEEYYKLDYEDVVGDLRTRFKYKEVPSNTYGLSTEKILITDDKELNQYVSLKKLAPYRTEEWKPPRHHRFSQKKRKRLALQGGESDHTKRPKKSKSEGRSKDGGLKHTKGQKKSKSKGRGEVIPASNSNDQERKRAEETNGAVDSTSKKHNMGRQKRGPVVPLSRLMAYGKVPFRVNKTKK